MMPSPATSQRTSDRSSSSSSSLHLSPSELRFLVTPDDTGEVSELLLDHPSLTPRFLHFQSINRTITRLEQMLDTAHDELLDVFEDMKDHHLEDALTFFVTRQQQQQGLRPHTRRSRSVRIQSPPPPFSPRRQTPVPRRQTPYPSRNATSAGTRNNPIDVEDSNEPSPSPSSSQYVTAAEETVQYVANADATFRQMIPPSATNPCLDHYRHSFGECSTRRCAYCNGLWHTEANCTRKNERIILPSGVALSPAGEVLEDSPRSFAGPYVVRRAHGF
jgi:hypothetical protein